MLTSQGREIKGTFSVKHFIMFATSANHVNENV